MCWTLLAVHDSCPCCFLITINATVYSTVVATITLLSASALSSIFFCIALNLKKVHSKFCTLPFFTELALRGRKISHDRAPYIAYFISVGLITIVRDQDSSTPFVKVLTKYARPSCSNFVRFSPSPLSWA